MAGSSPAFVWLIAAARPLEAAPRSGRPAPAAPSSLFTALLVTTAPAVVCLERAPVRRLARLHARPVLRQSHRRPHLHAWLAALPRLAQPARRGAVFHQSGGTGRGSRPAGRIGCWSCQSSDSSLRLVKWRRRVIAPHLCCSGCRCRSTHTPSPGDRSPSTSHCGGRIPGTTPATGWKCCPSSRISLGFLVAWLMRQAERRWPRRARCILLAAMVLILVDSSS